MVVVLCSLDELPDVLDEAGLSRTLRSLPTASPLEFRTTSIRIPVPMLVSTFFSLVAMSLFMNTVRDVDNPVPMGTEG